MTGRRFDRRLGRGEWPSGTSPILYQDVAPPGYLIVSAVDEHSIRLTDGDTVNGGTTGGTYDFSTQFALKAEEATPGVGGHQLNEAETGPHDHPAPGSSPTYVILEGGAGGFRLESGSFNYTTDNANTASAGSGTAHYHSVDLRVKWAACIVVQKQ